MSKDLFDVWMQCPGTNGWTRVSSCVTYDEAVVLKKLLWHPLHFEPAGGKPDDRAEANTPG